MMRLQFSVRTLLIVILLASMLLGTEACRAHKIAKLVRSVQSMKGSVRLIPRFGDPADPAGYHFVGPLDPPMKRTLLLQRRIKSVRIDGAGGTGGMLDILKALPNIEGLVCHSTTLNDDGLERIGRLRTLVRLDLAGSTLEPAGLLHLANLKKLDSLGLSGSNVSDESLSLIPKLPSLRQLRLGGTAVTDAGVSHIGSARRLENLSLSNTAISDASLAVIVQLPNLKVVSLDGTAVTDAGVSHISTARRLEHLKLSNTAVSDASLAVIVQLPNLKVVSLDGTAVTPVGIAKLRLAKPQLAVSR